MDSSTQRGDAVKAPVGHPERLGLPSSALRLPGRGSPRRSEKLLVKCWTRGLAGVSRLWPTRWSGSRATLHVLIPVGLLAFLAWSWRWTTEDAFIYFRVAENFVQGHGPVFNIGERVEAYTSPLWLVALVVPRGLLPGLSIEWIAVVGGLLLSILGLFAAVRGALRLHKARPSAAFTLPLGGVVIASVPAMWDYATSGLETSLVFAWLGLVFWGLVAVADSTRTQDSPAKANPDPDRRKGRARHDASAIALAIGIGLGPLVRPDLAIFAGGFLVTLWLITRSSRALGSLLLLGAASAIPLAYQIFRMGYFGTLLPNTALAKEASAVFWGRGLDYLEDLSSSYLLWVPIPLLVGFAVFFVRDRLRASDGKSVVLAAAPIACALVHILYVVRLGGDYMHGRMLLPSLFGLLLPLAVVRVGTFRSASALLVVIASWSIVCVTSLRAPAQPPDDPGALVVYDQRRRYADNADRPEWQNPVELTDYERLSDVRTGRGLALRAAKGPPAMLMVYGKRLRAVQSEGARPLRPRQDLPVDVVAYVGAVGRRGVAAGPGVHLVDRPGLADPVGSRLRLNPIRGFKPGHEKNLPLAWVEARFAEPTRDGAAPSLAVAAARHSLSCEPLSEIVAATSAPLTFQRFSRNVALAVRTHGFRLPPDPIAAEREICRVPSARPEVDRHRSGSG